MPLDEGHRNHRPGHRGHRVRQIRLHPLQFPQRHTGNLYATEIAVETVDLCLTRILKACDEHNCILVVTADHGNSDQMLEKNKKGNVSVRTAHSLRPVPFIIHDPDERHEMDTESPFGLANVAPTVVELLGLKPYDCWEKSMLK